MRLFTSTVSIECETVEQAEQVLGERLTYDEDYGFRYVLWHDSVTPPRPPKTTIIVHSWHTPGSCGGFNWYPADGIDTARLQYGYDVQFNDFENVILVEFDIAIEGEVPDPDQRNAVTEYIDAHLLDLIETGQIGRIIARHRRA